MRYISVAFVFIGTLMGAGFVSGREAAVFFSGTGIWGPLAAAVVSGVGALAFMSIGPGPEVIICPYRPALPKIVIRAECLVILSATLALSETLGRSLFSLPGGAVPAAAAVLAVSASGRFGYKVVTVFSTAIALLIALTIALKLDTPFAASEGTFPLMPIGYAAMNILIPAMTVSRYTEGFSVRQKALASAMISLLTFGIIYLYMNVVRGAESATLPAVENAAPTGMKIPLMFVLIISAVTSGAATINTAAKSPGGRASIVIAALLMSLSGFGNIVEYVYPVTSYAALIVVFCAVYRAAARLKNSCKKEAALI